MTSTKQRTNQATMQADSAPALHDDQQDEALSNQLVAYRATQPFITPAMQQFAEHWAHYRNQIKAYQHAFPGSSANAAKTQARRLFADPRVQLEILRVMDRWTDHSAVKLAGLEHELSRIARADVRNLFDEHGKIRQPHEWDADTAAAVSSYQEEERWEGRGEDRTKVTTRKVRLAEKHGPLRTLMEAKGAFEKQKAPPGAAAIFNINLGGVPLQLGAPVIDGRTITMDLAQPGKGKKSPVRPMGRGQKPEKRPQRALAHPAAVSKPRHKASKPSGSDEISTLSTVKQVSEAQTVEISTPSGKPDLF